MKPVLVYLRTVGFVNAIYTDDMYLQGMSPEEYTEKTITCLRLLQDLGFIISVKKSVIVPSQQITMLGFILCSSTMTVRLIPEKAQVIVDMCMNLLVDESHMIHSIKVIIGKFCSSFPSVEFGKLHYRGLENLKIESLQLHHCDLKAVTSLTDNARGRCDLLE